MNPVSVRPIWRLAVSFLGLLTATFMTSGQCLSADEPQTPHDKPNIIYIMADDLGYGDLGCYGQKRVKTPHIDRLAAEGMRFTEHYSGHTVCRPSRLVLWTGFHSANTPIDSNAGYVFKPEDVTVAELLQEAGYVTGGVGKWAMGGPGTPGVPIRNGFNFWFGYLDQSEAHNYYPTHLFRCLHRGPIGPRVDKVPLKGNVLMGDSRPQSRVAKPNHRVTYSHDVMTSEALDFIRRHRDGPFLLHVHWTIPHANNEGGRVTGNGMEVPDYGMYKDRDWPETEKGFAAMVTRMDRDVGRLVELLRKLDIDEKTVVFFTSDNGPHQEGGHKMEFFDSNGPLRGYKRDLYEGGIRVPMIVWWPGTIEAGTVSDHPSAFWDFLPTACELAGIEPPRNIDGISYLPELLGNAQKQHEYLYWQFRGKAAVRQGTWKAVRPGSGKAVELYNLKDDLGEQKNVAEQHTDITAEMKQVIDQMQARTDQE